MTTLMNHIGADQMNCFGSNMWKLNSLVCHISFISLSESWRTSLQSLAPIKYNWFFGKQASKLHCSIQTMPTKSVKDVVLLTNSIQFKQFCVKSQNSTLETIWSVIDFENVINKQTMMLIFESASWQVVLYLNGANCNDPLVLVKSNPDCNCN